MAGISIKARYLITIVFLLIISVAVNFLSYDPFYKAKDGLSAINGIPLNVKGWMGRNFPIENKIYEILETKSIIHRKYYRNRNEVLLSVVYYPETKVDFHDPGSCLGGQGIEIHRSLKQIKINEEIILDLNQIIWRSGNDEQLVYYFYKAGNYLGRSYIWLRLNLARNKFSNSPKSGSLIRLSTNVLSGDYERAGAILSEAIRDLYPYILKAL